MKLLRLLALCLLPVSALAAPPQYQINLGVNTGTNQYLQPSGYQWNVMLAQSPSGAFVPLQTDASGYIYCDNCAGGGGGGGSGSAVTQSTGSSSNPWWFEGLGTAGGPTGGVLSVQGVPGGTGIPVTGNFYQSTQPVSLATAPTTPVTGTFWQATQPVSAASLPLPTGAATSANQATPQTPGTSAGTAEPVQGVTGGVPIPVQQPAYATTTSNGTITTANTFQSVLASNTNRKGCLITNTSSSAMSVALGASPTSAQALSLAAGSQMDCSHPSGATLSDQINLTSATAGATFVVWAQ